MSHQPEPDIHAILAQLAQSTSELVQSSNQHNYKLDMLIDQVGRLTEGLVETRLLIQDQTEATRQHLEQQTETFRQQMEQQTETFRQQMEQQSEIARQQAEIAKQQSETIKQQAEVVKQQSEAAKIQAESVARLLALAEQRG